MLVDDILKDLTETLERFEVDNTLLTYTLGLLVLKYAKAEAQQVLDNWQRSLDEVKAR